MPPKSNHGHGHANGNAHGGDAGGDAAGFPNHGAEVSAAAHDAPRGRGERHGDAVSEIARGVFGTDRPDAAGADDDEDRDGREAGPLA